MIDVNLLNITTTPIEIELDITQGRLQNQHAPLPMPTGKVSKGDFTITSELAKVNIDSYKARSSMGYGHYNIDDFTSVSKDKAIKAADEGTRKSVNEGNQLARGAKASDIAKQNNRAGYTIQTVMDFIPKDGVDISVEKGNFDINIQKNEVEIDWQNLEVTPLQFIPGSVELRVVQRPRVDIEYVGRPLYVPPSADPAIKYSFDSYA